MSSILGHIDQDRALLSNTAGEFTLAALAQIRSTAW